MASSRNLRYDLAGARGGQAVRGSRRNILDPRRFAMMLRRSVLLLLFSLCCPLAAHAQDQQGSIFTVADVPVDATAQSAVQARDKARLEGQQKAFHMLIDRIVAKQYQARSEE